MSQLLGKHVLSMWLRPEHMRLRTSGAAIMGRSLVWHPGMLPPVQKAALALLPTLTPSHLPQLWPDLLMALLHLMRPELVAQASEAGPEDPAGALSLRTTVQPRRTNSLEKSLGTLNVNKGALSCALQQRVLDTLVLLFRSALLTG